jgi:spermidine/putrescine transport system substrate-binding protein
MKATKGKGYDLILPSDYAVQLLAREDLLKPIDKSQVLYWNQINPALLNHFYDPDNRFSIPSSWEIYGIGINRNFFVGEEPEPSWDLIFAAPPYKITMVNDPIEAVLFGSFYLYGPVLGLDAAQTENVKNLLIQQKSWVEAYTDFRADYYLATKNCPVVLSSSSYIWQSLDKWKFIDFIIPKEGSLITIENFCIPEKSKKDALVYQLINHLMEPHSIVTHYKTYGFFPSTLHALDKMDLSPKEEKLIRSTSADFKKFHFTKMLIPEQQIRDIWVEVKS